MTSEAYRQICELLARDAIRYAAEKVADEEMSDDFDAQCEHWIDVYLDKHLPSLDADALLAVTLRAAPAPSREIAARYALQMDVWAAINNMEERRGV